MLEKVEEEEDEEEGGGEVEGEGERKMMWPMQQAQGFWTLYKPLWYQKVYAYT